MSIYNWDYYSCMLQNYAATARQISETRWDFVSCLKQQVVLDYGSGCGFFAMFSPKDTIVHTYDIGRINGRPYPQTGIGRANYDLVTLWDVLEHIDWEKNPDKVLLDVLARTKYAAASVPVLPNGRELTTWKHYKPSEHLTDFNTEKIDRLFTSIGFELMELAYPECPPREDIVSVLYRRYNEFRDT